MNRTVIPVLALAALEGCLDCHRLLNAPSLRRYAEKLVAASGTRLALGRCAMFDGSRKGYCLLEGPARELAAFASRLKLPPGQAGRALNEQSCLAFPGSAARRTPRWWPGRACNTPAPATRCPRTPTTSELVSVYTGTAAACLELEYPYG